MSGARLLGVQIKTQKGTTDQGCPRKTGLQISFAGDFIWTIDFRLNEKKSCKTKVQIKPQVWTTDHIIEEKGDYRSAE